MVGKGEIACHMQFLIFPQCFLPFGQPSTISSNLKLSSANPFSLKVENLLCEKGLGVIFKKRQNFIFTGSCRLCISAKGGCNLYLVRITE